MMERPHSSEYITLLARSNGVYNRPVAGRSFDVRIEDFMPLAELGITGVNFICQLPNSRRFMISTFNTVQSTDAKEDLVNILRAKVDQHGKPFYAMLPSKPGDEYYDVVGSPWWEWAAIYDEYNGHIKAPKRPRAGEPTAEEIDERLDEFPDNVGKVDVVSPETFMKWETAGVVEDYRKRLRRIR